MSLWRIAWNYLWSRKLTTLLTILSVALGVGLIATVLTLVEETRRRFEDEGRIFDFVVGPSGSPLQLVLGGAYFMDDPYGNIKLSDFERLKQDESVKEAFPIGLGDTYKSKYRIVGTVPEILEYTYTDTWGDEHKPFRLGEGSRPFDRPMEAVIGHLVALQNGLKVGDTFSSMHGSIEIPEELGGVSHAHHPYTVVGVLEASGTPVDRAIFTSMESIWDLHEEPHHHDEADHHADEAASHAEGEDEERDESAPARDQVTAVLVKLHSLALQFQFERHVRNEYGLLAAQPTRVIANFYDQFMAPLQTALVSVGFLVVVVSALSIMIGLYLSIYQRKRDLAIMRALGASSGEIFGGVLIEAFLVTILGIAAGWLLSAGLTYGIGVYMTREFGLSVSPFVTSSLLLSAFSVVGLVGLLAGVLPAYQAYRTDVARDLASV